MVKSLSSGVFHFFHVFFQIQVIIVHEFTKTLRKKKPQEGKQDSFVFTRER